jgi:radical SAM protein with 4Fe4S-binding SPASM domain
LSLLRRLGRPRSLADLRSYYWKDMAQMYGTGATRSTPCPFLYDQFALDARGDVYYCFPTRSIGNVRDGRSVSEIYYDARNQTFRRGLPGASCRRCNSACNVGDAIARDLKRYLRFRITGRL